MAFFLILQSTGPVHAQLPANLGDQPSASCEQSLTARFRARDGTMKSGRIRERTGLDQVRISDLSGRSMMVVHSHLLPIEGPNDPRTPTFPFWWRVSLFDQGPRLTNVLHQAAQLVSSPEFRSMSPHKKLKTLSSLARKTFSIPLADDEDPPFDFDEAIYTSRGDCQHRAMLVSAILLEAGFNARLVAIWPANEPAHVWVEVELPTQGQSVTYVIDPSQNLFVASMEDVMAEARGQGSYSARWYAHPERVYNTP